MDNGSLLCNTIHVNSCDLSELKLVEKGRREEGCSGFSAAPSLDGGEVESAWHAGAIVGGGGSFRRLRENPSFGPGVARKLRAVRGGTGRRQANSRKTRIIRKIYARIFQIWGRLPKFGRHCERVGLETRRSGDRRSIPPLWTFSVGFGSIIGETFGHPGTSIVGTRNSCICQP